MAQKDGTVLDLEFSLVAVLILASVIGYVFIYMIIRQRVSPLSKIKAVPGFPILGPIFRCLFTRNEVEMVLEWMKYTEDDGIFRSRGVVGWELVGIFKPEFVKQVLVTNCKNYIRPVYFKNVFVGGENGLFLATGKEHALQRKLMNPIFSYASVRGYCKSFDEHTLGLVKVWSKRCTSSSSGTGLVTVESDMTNLTVDIICDLAFGYEFHCGEGNSKSPFKILLEGTMTPVELLKSAVLPFYNYLFTRSSKKMADARSLANEIIDKIIKQKREMLKRETNEYSKDLLALMLKLVDDESGEKMTDEVLRSNIWTFMIAGHETTSTGLTWTLYHLARNPDVQEKARKEALKVRKRNSSILPEDLESLTYVTAVIKESLRMTPPGARILRQAIKDDSLGEYFIPTGTIITIFVAGIHNYEKYWREPEKFKPERFLESDDTWSGGISGQTYLPFSSGPRNCIGSKFAMMEMKVILARLLTSFRFSISPDHPKVGNVLMLTLKPRYLSPNLILSPISEEEAEQILAES